MDSTAQNNYATLQKRMKPLEDLGAMEEETLEEHQQMKKNMLRNINLHALFADNPGRG